MKNIAVLALMLASSAALAQTTTSSAPAKLQPKAKGVVVRSIETNSPQAWSATNQVLSSPKGNILIDPGSYDSPVASYIKSIGGVKAILITHGHWANIRGLDAALKANPGAKVYVHALDYPYFKDMTRNTSIEDGSNGTTNAKAELIKEGNYKILNYNVRVIHLPGHTEGSVLYYFPDENIMFAGDTIMPMKVGSSNHPGANAKDRAASIARFKKMKFPADMIIYNGHFPEATYAQVMRENEDLK